MGSYWGVARFQEFAKQYTKYIHTRHLAESSSAHNPHPQPHHHSNPHPHLYVSRVVGIQTCLYLSIFISFLSASRGAGQPHPHPLPLLSQCPPISYTEKTKVY